MMVLSNNHRIVRNIIGDDGIYIYIYLTIILCQLNYFSSILNHFFPSLSNNATLQRINTEGQYWAESPP